MKCTTLGAITFAAYLGLAGCSNKEEHPITSDPIPAPAASLNVTVPQRQQTQNYEQGFSGRLFVNESESGYTGTLTLKNAKTLLLEIPEERLSREQGETIKKCKVGSDVACTAQLTATQISDSAAFRTTQVYLLTAGTPRQPETVTLEGTISSVDLNNGLDLTISVTEHDYTGLYELPFTAGENYTVHVADAGRTARKRLKNECSQPDACKVTVTLSAEDDYSSVRELKLR